jgi:hypothetical protein
LIGWALGGWLFGRLGDRIGRCRALSLTILTYALFTGLSFFALTYARLVSVSRETSHSAWLRNTRDVQLASAPLTGLIAVSDRYDRKATLAAGRVWQRLHLSATARGLAMQPLNQPIEMIDRERQTGQGDQWAKRIARLTGDEWQATFSFRAGFASRPAPPSPRRRLKDVVLE